MESSSHYSEVCRRLASLEYDGTIQIHGGPLGIVNIDHTVCSKHYNNQDSNVSLITFSIFLIKAIVAVISIIAYYYLVYTNGKKGKPRFISFHSHTKTITMNKQAPANELVTRENSVVHQQGREVMVQPMTAVDMVVVVARRVKQNAFAEGMPVNNETALNIATKLCTNHSRMLHDGYQQSLNRSAQRECHLETLAATREERDWAAKLIGARDESFATLLNGLIQAFAVGCTGTFFIVLNSRVVVFLDHFRVFVGHFVFRFLKQATVQVMTTESTRTSWFDVTSSFSAIRSSLAASFLSAMHAISEIFYFGVGAATGLVGWLILTRCFPTYSKMFNTLIVAYLMAYYAWYEFTQLIIPFTFLGAWLCFIASIFVCLIMVTYNNCSDHTSDPSSMLVNKYICEFDRCKTYINFTYVSATLIWIVFIWSLYRSL